MTYYVYTRVTLENKWNNTIKEKDSYNRNGIIKLIRVKPLNVYLRRSPIAYDYVMLNTWFRIVVILWIQVQNELV